MSRTPRALLLCATLVAPFLAAAQAKQDTTRTAPARPPVVAKRSAAETIPRAVARDRVGAADTTCDDLCRRERMMDSVYGKDRERLPAPTAPTRRPR